MNIKGLGLRGRIITLVMGIVLVSTLSSYFISNMAKSLAQKKIENILQSNVRGINEVITSLFYERYGDVKVFAANIGKLKSLTSEEIVSLFNEWVVQYGTYDLILMLDPEGKVIRSNTQDAKGKSIQSQNLINMSLSGETWFQKLTKKQFNENPSSGLTGVVVDTFQFDRFSQAAYGGERFGNGFATEIRDADHKLLGYLATRANEQWILDALKNFYQGEKSEGYPSTSYNLVDPSGKVLLALDAEGMGSVDKRPFTKENFDKYNLESLDMSMDILKGQEDRFFASFHKEGNHEEISYIKRVSGSKFVEDLGWRVVVSVHKSEVFYDLVRLTWMIGAFLMVTAVVSIVLGLLFANRLAVQMKKVISQVHKTQSEVSFASRELLDTAVKLSASNQQQASSLQQTASATYEISAQVQQTSHLAVNSKERSQASVLEAQQGALALQKLTQAVSAIADSSEKLMQEVNHSHREMESIVAVVGEIEAKTRVINDIVFQTKLLSFNASIEAARAGDQGKGFAVVAEEVGNLAQMSGSASQEISSLLLKSAEKVRKMVVESQQKVDSSMSNARAKVTECQRSTQTCLEEIQKIQSSISNINGSSEELSRCTSDQTQGVLEINSAVQELEKGNLVNVAASDKTKTISQKLVEYSENLGFSVQSLEKLLKGQKENRNRKDRTQQSGRLEEETPLDSADRASPEEDSEDEEMISRRVA